MKITKDEAYILACALQDAKYNLLDAYQKSNSDLMDVLSDFESQLFEYAKDQRRVGRKSLDSYSDILTRYCKKIKN